MSFLHRVFGRKREPLLIRAQALVEVARVSAVTMFTPLSKRFPVLLEADTQRWDFILTVAGVFMAATRLVSLRLGESLGQRLQAAFMEKLDQWDPDGIRAFRDCRGLFEAEVDRLTAAGHDAPFVASDAVGIWIFWNVFWRPPRTDEDATLVRTAGAMVTQTFFDWWAA